MTQIMINSTVQTRSAALERGIAIIIALLMPALLVLIGARLAMTMTFVSFEYHRPDFPVDFYGFTLEERLLYAPYALDYLLNGEDIDYLGDLTFPDGAPLFNQRELRHMHDVKMVTQSAFAFAVIAGIVVALGSTILWRRDRRWLRRALRAGAIWTLALIIGVVILTVVSWNVFFTAFHQVFFEDNTWIFLTSDTLIRLFPERFWFDAALFIGAVCVVGALLMLLIAWRWRTPATARQ
jgi:integral membrane protein (TIGR01906 family)